MKKQVQAFIRKLGGSSSYSGKKKTLFITDPKGDEIELATLGEFGLSLPFKLATNMT